MHFGENKIICNDIWYFAYTDSFLLLIESNPDSWTQLVCFESIDVSSCCYL